ncbi:murein DD-endopeptidase MepM/ murein hydrolase activator NlpD [Pontibacter aydingkolensis]|uniref:Peptidoglycan DD-metalloendopeptidase family protein n=1 Tax=Pontibacter aydingkolensis TaxID=1911536 RepID=A0ABS7CVS9_9BACT|nr:peptidoglycan DD-metalloendopeptidase family protein [Pontibacter aydingkolensis]MBW7467607.1 peptidoglycan DD-metalloendopeptidase family protein [Pontibacter aydingkolensis]
MYKRSKGLATLLALALLFCIIAARLLTPSSDEVLARQNELKPNINLVKAEKAPAPVVYGIPTDTMGTVEDEVKRGENLSEILTKYNISPTQVHALAQKAKKIYNVRRIAAKSSYTILHSLDSAQTAHYFIYEPNPIEYVIYDLRGETAVTHIKRDIEVIERTLAGEIKSSLFESMVEAGGTAQLVNKFADIYGWRLNLNHLQPGDKFKLIYDEKVVNGTTIGYGELKSAVFEHNGQEVYAIGFDQGNGMGYYDEKGQSLKRAFLKEPLEYSRVSSRFSKRRFHPVQKRYKAHLGTDFAAPRGTPIRTVGDGKVLEARYTRGNGYYVKIKHNKTYTTQYLHMSKFAKGIRAGARVKQGQTIGYVGSTGLATGPHLCYRFWKNGRQVDALRVKLPTADPIRKKNMETFTALKEETMRRMEAIDMTNTKPALLASEKGKEPTDA